MKKGKHESASGGWQRGGDPFAAEKPSQTGTAGKKKASASGGWQSWGKGRKAGVIALSCAAALALLIGGWWTLFVRAPDVSGNDRPGVTNNDPNKKPGDTEQDEDNGSLVSGRKDDYYTFLLIGRDTAGGGNTDTLILVSYDVPNGQVNMMSIPRDTAVNVSWTNKKINSVYNAKESNGGGMEGLKQQVAYLTGVMPDRYVIIEWKAVGELVDAVDGVEFDVPRNMNYDDPYQDLHIHFNKGMQTLNGQKAMELLRYRKDNKRPDGTIVGYDDVGRMNTQRDFLKAMAKKVLQLGNITKIGEFIDIFMENVETDMTLTEMMWFASKAISVDVDAMQSSTLPYIDLGLYRKEYFFLPNGPEIVPLINEQFNPYNREITEDDLRIIVKNKDGSCYVTGGELLDTAWASPVRSSEGTTGGGVSTTKPTGITADPNVSTGQKPDTTPEEPTLPPEPDLPDGETDAPSVTPDPDATPDTPDTPPVTDPGTDGTTPPATDPGATPDAPPAETPDPEVPDTDPGTAEPPAEQVPPVEEPPEPVLPPDPVLPPE